MYIILKCHRSLIFILDWTRKIALILGETPCQIGKLKRSPCFASFKRQNCDVKVSNYKRVWHLIEKGKKKVRNITKKK